MTDNDFNNMINPSFDEYVKQTEPGKSEKGYAWYTAIGLQAVDGLKPSDYLLKTAIKNIEGEIDFTQAESLLNSYYKENVVRSPDKRTEEADKVSLRIAQILSEKAFSFSVSEYLSIHSRLFFGIYKHAGKIRDYNISKNEWVLDGKSVLYGNAFELRAALQYDIDNEKSFDYKGLSSSEIIKHISFFISRLWQIHAFGEGNTRTTAVFLIKYLRYLGYDVGNESFAKNAWYFRNALVRANYNDIKNGIHETTEFLELFLRNLLLGEVNELHNRDMHISGLLSQKPDIEAEKPDIEVKKPDIEDKKPDIESLLSTHVQQQVEVLKQAFENKVTVFGRNDISKILGLAQSTTSELIKKLVEKNVIVPVKGHGKGKYIFYEK